MNNEKIEVFKKHFLIKVFFQKVEYLVKTVEKRFLKKLSIWLSHIKVAL